MSELLSQNEIDDLLRSLTSGSLDKNDGDESDGGVKVYDFKSANKFSKEQIKILHNIYDNFSQLFSTYLSGTLRTTCQFEVVSVEELTYNEYINSLSSPVVLAVLDINPMGSPTLLELSSVVAYEIISRSLGGSLSNSKIPKSFTDIDLALLEKMFLHITKLVDSSWSKVISVDTKFEKIETSPQFAQIVSYNEPTAIITICAKIGENVEGVINACIPRIAIEPIAKQLNTKLWYTNEVTGAGKHILVNLKQKLINTKVDVSVAFKDTTAKIEDILSLQVGDVLQLVHKVDEKLLVKVCDKNVFLGELGVIKNKYVCKITETIKEASQYYE